MRPSRAPLQFGSMMLLMLGCVTGVSLAACSGTQTAGATGDPTGTATIEPLTEGDPELEKAKGLIANEKYEDAIPVLEKVVARDPKNAEAIAMLGLALDALGKTAEAEKRYKEALALDPKLGRVSQNLAALYINATPPKAAEAVPLLKQALETEPNNVDAIRNLALAYALLGETEKSSKAYEAAIKVKPEDEATIRYEYGSMLLGAKKSAEGLEQLKLSMAKSDDPALLASVANTFGMAKAFDQCVAALDKAITKGPDAKWFMGRGECKHGLKDEKGASADFQEAVKLDPKSPQAHFYMAMSLIELKKMDDAKAELKQVCELGPESKACANAQKVAKKNNW